MNESEETEGIKTHPLPLLVARIAGLAQLKTNISWTTRPFFLLIKMQICYRHYNYPSVPSK